MPHADCPPECEYVTHCQTDPQMTDYCPRPGNWRQKPDEGRLLTDDEIEQVYEPKMVRCVDFDDLKEYASNVAKAQDIKTAGIKEAQCQARVDGIFKEIEGMVTPVFQKPSLKRPDEPLKISHYQLSAIEFENLKLREGMG